MADLSDSSLEKCEFSGALFYYSNLAKANLSKAILAKADFEGANLASANLSGAKFSKMERDVHGGSPNRNLTRHVQMRTVHQFWMVF